ncbi:MAG: DpnI domain-containing protein, partial [Nanoarchaeota archaeon]
IMRVATESWVDKNIFCPNCGHVEIERFSKNMPVADFYCSNCSEQYELKSKKDKIGNKIVDGAYSTMIKRLKSAENPNLKKVVLVETATDAPAPKIEIPDPAGKTVDKLQIIPLKQGAIPGVVGDKAAQAPQADKPVQQHAIPAADGQFQIVSIYKNPDGTILVSINKGTQEDGKWKIGERVGAAVMPSAAFSSNVLLNQWNGDLKNIPIQNGFRDASGCRSNNQCTYTDTLKDGSKTKTAITQAETTVEKFRTAYFYNGREITKVEYDKLKDEEKKNADEIKDWPISKLIEGKKDDKLFITTYKYDTIFDNNKKPIRIYEATKVNKETGEVEQFIYGEIVDGVKNEMVLNTPEGVNILDAFSAGRYTWDGDPTNKDLLDKANTAFNQYASRQFFANVERVFTEFQGLGYYATLFFDEDS